MSSTHLLGTKDAKHFCAWIHVLKLSSSFPPKTICIQEENIVHVFQMYKLRLREKPNELLRAVTCLGCKWGARPPGADLKGAQNWWPNHCWCSGSCCWCSRSKLLVTSLAQSHALSQEPRCPDLQNYALSKYKALIAGALIFVPLCMLGICALNPERVCWLSLLFLGGCMWKKPCAMPNCGC